MVIIESGVLRAVTHKELRDGVFTSPEGVTSIEGFAFFSCTSVRSVIISEGVQSIEDWAFESCMGLISVIIPESVTSIAGSAFWGCISLTRIIIDTESVDEYERIKGLLPSDLKKHARSKKAYLIGQSVLQDYEVFTSPLFSPQGPLAGHQDLIQMLENYQKLPENQDYLQVKKKLYAVMPPSLSDNESAWQMYEDKLSAITSEWKKKYREQCDGFTARDFIKKYIAPTAIKADLLDRLRQNLQKGEIVRLDTSDRELLQTLPILLTKIPQWILEKWVVTRRDPAPIALTSVSAALYSEHVEAGASASAAQVAPSATNAG